ncbi:MULTISPECIES: antibiotic biosynthesis monooxygenase [unclassified Lacticaseibacillus]|uniref:antibiotic biosynthesis monooxygenase family protein n=1 Tax=unclassified Lacticaseibacillus TaxID=2759744 RepID=UPI0019408578|nr:MULTISPECIES: antibiotic biosynthesis monooxygenase [unclassified Lacticaseibacillus]
MTKTMQLVLGSKTYMQTIVKRATTPVRLLKDAEKDRDFATLDLTGAVPFVAPLKGTILAHYGAVPEVGYVYMMYFKLTDEEAKVFEQKAQTLTLEADRLDGCEAMVLMRTDNPQREYLLLSAWATKLAVFTAKNTPLFAPVMVFTKRAQESYGYHQAFYTIADPYHPDHAMKAEATLDA